jgi:hypothetical protein
VERARVVDPGHTEDLVDTVSVVVKKRAAVDAVAEGIPEAGFVAAAAAVEAQRCLILHRIS